MCIVANLIRRHNLMEGYRKNLLGDAVALEAVSAKAPGKNPN